MAGEILFGAHKGIPGGTAGGISGWTLKCICSVISKGILGGTPAGISSGTPREIC